MRLIDMLFRSRRERDLNEEIASHLAMAARDRMVDGADPGSARFAARKEFGNVTLTREATRLVWGGLWIERLMHLARDVRYAGRLLWQSPGYAVVVIAVLTLGIGMNLVAFSSYKAFALTPLAGVPDSADLHVIAARTTAGRTVALSHRDFEYLRDHLDVYSGIAGTNFNPFTLGTGDAARRVFGEEVTGNYFQVLDVAAQLGRTLSPSDNVTRGGHPVVVLSNRLWRRDFGADPGVIGTTVRVNNVPLTVVGVTAADFHGTTVGIEMDLFLPLMMQPILAGGWDALDLPQAELLFGLARPLPGVSLGQGRTAAALAAQQLAAEHRVDHLDERAVVIPIQESPAGAQTYALPLVRLMGATSALLLIVVCANVAGLVLVRSISRRGEIAARLALGATRWRIVRLLLIENLLLAVPGAYLGSQFMRLAEPYLTSASGEMLSATLHFNWDGAEILVVAMILACISAVLCGLLPALQASRADVASVLKDALAPRGPASGRVRSALVVSQVAMSLVLLVGMTLVVRSLNAARHADPGFDPRSVASILVDLRPAGYTAATGRIFYDRLTDDLRAMDGVESVSLMNIPLLMLWDFGGRTFTVEGRDHRRDDDLEFGFNIVGRDHFRTLRIPLVAGRDFDARDDDAATAVAVVNETLARTFWGEPARAIGKRIRSAAWETGVPQWITIVGVARDIKYTRLTEDPRPYVYFSSSQAYSSSTFVHVRSSATTGLLERARARVEALDPNIPILEARMLADQTSLGLALYEVTARTLAVIGIAAMGLAALGIYGLVAYTVKQRTHEIGIRLAIGAPRPQILQRFLLRGVHLGVIGAALGIALSLAAAQLMSSMLYGVGATDAVSFAIAAGAVMVVALAASVVPAWRAARVDPLIALRHH